jgi:hypothetical protein
MTYNLTFLLLGIALLWFPRQWLRRVPALLKRRRRSKGSERIMEPWKDREPGDPKVNPRVELTKFRNYVDLVRAAAGSLLIWGGFGWAAALGVAADAPRSAGMQVLAIKCGIMTVGLVLQALRYEKIRISFFPPIFFLAGLSVGVCGYKAAAFAFLAVWALNTGPGNAQAFMSVYAIVLILFGGLFGGFMRPQVYLPGVLALLPVLLSLMSNRPLMIFTRKGSRG